MNRLHRIEALCSFLTLILLSTGLAWAHGSDGDSIHLQCEQPQGETFKITIHGGREFAGPGEVFGFDVETLRVNRCQKVEVTFINTDDVRHAFMIDGLSPGFMIEIPGKGEKTASFIAPEEDVTLLLHCHVPGHDRAGMNGEAIVGRGGGNILASSANQASWSDTAWIVLALISGFVVGGAGIWAFSQRKPSTA